MARSLTALERATPASEGVGRVLVGPRRLRRRVTELAWELNQRYAGQEVTVLGVLTGSFCFLADLVRQIEVPVRIQLLEVRRSVTDSSHSLQVASSFREPIAGRHVLVIEDIVDTGVTLATLLEAVRSEGPASLRVCALLDKAEARQVPVPLDYVGFHIRPLFVVGYGLDYQGLYRNLPFIGVVAGAVWPPAATGQATR